MMLDCSMLLLMRAVYLDQHGVSFVSGIGLVNVNC